MDPVLPPVKPKWIIYQELQEFVERASKPKKYPKPPRVDRGASGAYSNDRLNSLATPYPRKVYIQPLKDPNSWAYKLKHPVKQAALEYVASSRIAEIAIPKHKYVRQKPKPLIKKSVLTYIATPRIVSLAGPKKPRRKWKRKRPRYVNPKALKAKASKRVSSLAKPKKREEPTCKDPNINPMALKAFCSPRIRKLARPKPLITEVREHPILARFRKHAPEDDDEDEDED